MQQPLDFIATIAGTALAIGLQKWGWKLQAKRLVLATLEDIEQRISQRATETATTGKSDR
jgi:hypothetical protein